MQAGNDVRGLEVAIKNIINASYSRDLSAKIAAADHVMQKKGMYLGGYRPFGFLPDPNDCHKLILDPVASQYVKQAEHILEILHERERKVLICFSALERQEEKLSAEKAEIVKRRVALYEQYADGNMSKEEFIRQRDAYRAQEDERMVQIQRLRTEKNQIFQPVKKDADNLQTAVSAVEESGDVMHLSQNVVETFIDRIEVFNDERVKIHFTFEDLLADYAE